jgi:BRCA1-like protein
MSVQVWPMNLRPSLVTDHVPEGQSFAAKPPRTTHDGELNGSGTACTVRGSVKRAFRRIGALIDLSGDLGRDEGLKRALGWYDQLSQRRLTDRETSLLEYFRANAWANRQKLKHRARCAGMVVLRAIRETGIPVERWCELLDDDPIRSRSPRVAMEGNPDGPHFGEVMVFTGSLTIERTAAAQMASAAGCEIAGSVTKRTTILVVGDQDVRFFNGPDKSSKQRKAEQMIAAGTPIRIISESDFKALVDIR